MSVLYRGLQKSDDDVENEKDDEKDDVEEVRGRGKRYLFGKLSYRHDMSHYDRILLARRRLRSSLH